MASYFFSFGYHSFVTAYPLPVPDFYFSSSRLPSFFQRSLPLHCDDEHLKSPASTTPFLTQPTRSNSLDSDTSSSQNGSNSHLNFIERALRPKLMQHIGTSNEAYESCMQKAHEQAQRFATAKSFTGDFFQRCKKESLDGKKSGSVNFEKRENPCRYMNP